MDVSIVIPTKNAGENFAAVLDAVFSQKTSYSFEVICVDSGSNDVTIDVIKRHPCKLVCIAPEEFGHGKTRNLGASRGTGEYIVFLTHDALPASDAWLQELVDAMRIDDKVVGGFGAHLTYPGCNLLDARDIAAHFASFGSENKVLYIDDEDRYRTDEYYYRIASFFSDNNACIRRDIWEAHPYPDVEFAEDQIWMRMMLEKGYRKVYCPEAAVYHSHNFKLTEYFKRYYDEYQALYSLYGEYLIVGRMLHIPKAAASSAKRDVSYVWSQSLPFVEKCYWTHYSVWRNVFKYLAGYLGGTSNMIDPQKKMRRDKRFSQQRAQRRA